MAEAEIITRRRKWSAEQKAARVDHIEIELPNGVRVRVAGSVNEKALSRVFRVLKGVM